MAAVISCNSQGVKPTSLIIGQSRASINRHMQIPSQLNISCSQKIFNSKAKEHKFQPHLNFSKCRICNLQSTPAGHTRGWLKSAGRHVHVLLLRWKTNAKNPLLFSAVTCPQNSTVRTNVAFDGKTSLAENGSIMSYVSRLCNPTNLPHRCNSTNVKIKIHLTQRT